ncbi:MAG: glycosyltransferase family 4 protein [Clostridia bacterium]|nr:glycosyltransferase family 4 protein [Clostridia bacterium]MBQ8893199.1 glycosyltransferase family 4 protein [Clostridia bacterium]
MKKIAFLVLHLGYGGTERAVVSEANLLSDFCDVEIFCLYQLLEKPAFELDPRVKVTYLAKGLKPNREGLHDAFRRKNPFKILEECTKSARILYLRRHLMKKAIKKCDADVIISSRYMYHQLLTKYAKKGTVCIAQEHNHHNGNEEYIQQQVDAVRDMDYFMPVSRELTEFYSGRVHPGVKCKYIPHHLDDFPKETSPLTEKNLIAVGRLSPEKGMDELVLVYQELAEKYPGWKLHIVGDGEEREALEAQIAELGLNDQIVMHGFKNKKEINALLMQSSIYVMTSHTESFGLVLIEAQALGVPCVAYDSAQGAREIIQSGVNGLLIPNRDRAEMVAALGRLIEDESYRKAIGRAGKESAYEYSAEQVRSKWLEFINTL